MIRGALSAATQHSQPVHTKGLEAWHAMAKFGDEDSAYMQPIHGSGTQGGRRLTYGAVWAR